MHTHAHMLISCVHLHVQQLFPSLFRLWSCFASRFWIHNFSFAEVADPGVSRRGESALLLQDILCKVEQSWNPHRGTVCVWQSDSLVSAWIPNWANKILGTNLKIGRRQKNSGPSHIEVVNVLEVILFMCLLITAFKIIAQVNQKTTISFAFLPLLSSSLTPSVSISYCMGCDTSAIWRTSFLV